MRIANKHIVLKAINTLINYYDSVGINIIPDNYGVAKNTTCPLCQFPCDECPWYVIEKASCFVNEYYKQTTEERLKRLISWKEKIDKGEAYAE